MILAIARQPHLQSRTRHLQMITGPALPEITVVTGYVSHDPRPLAAPLEYRVLYTQVSALHRK